MSRGYLLVDPDLANPKHQLDYDTQVRCLSYLAKNLHTIVSVPEGVLFEVIPIQFLGGPYPGIGLYTETFIATDDNLWRLSHELHRKLSGYITSLGISKLVEYSSSEKLTWEDVVGPHREALLRVQDEWRRDAPDNKL